MFPEFRERGLSPVRHSLLNDSKRCKLKLTDNEEFVYARSVAYKLNDHASGEFGIIELS